MKIKISYDYHLLDEEVIDKIIPITNKIKDMVFKNIIKATLSNMNININIIIVDKAINTISVKRNTNRYGRIVIEKQVNKEFYDIDLKNQTISDMLDIIKILDQLRFPTVEEGYSLAEKEILEYFNYQVENINFNEEISEVCQLISKARKICSNQFSAAYEFKGYFKKSTFIKYRTYELFIFLYEELIKLSILLSYKAAKINLKAFGIYEDYNHNKEDKYYFLHEYLMSFCESPPVKRTKWFYIRRMILLIPLYMAIQTAQLIYPILVIGAIIGSLYMDYLNSKNMRKYTIATGVVNMLLYMFIWVVAIYYYMDKASTIGLVN